ncbi:MAG TPA: DUF2771 domain-containing protein [Streptomyces sp.]|jgi:hypothetical protein|nr:DUF2771 domain-containing protein [Streptomyces sp.]
MSYAISRRRPRTTVAIGAASLGLLALTGCQKPSPLVTATVNSETVTAEAACYDEGKTLPGEDAKKCLGEEAEKTVKLGPGDKFRLGVEPDTAESGWLFVVGNRPALSGTVKKTYYTFDGDSLFREQTQDGGTTTRKSVKASVVQMKDGQFKGIWHFELRKTD